MIYREILKKDLSTYRHHHHTHTHAHPRTHTHVHTRGLVCVVSKEIIKSSVYGWKVDPKYYTQDPNLFESKLQGSKELTSLNEIEKVSVKGLKHFNLVIFKYGHYQSKCTVTPIRC